MQNIIDFLLKADNIATIAAGVIVALLTVGKVGWDMWKKRKKPTPPVVVEEQLSTESIEILSQTYIGIIQTLRKEMDTLKQEVGVLSALKIENERCTERIKVLEAQNAALVEANMKQEKKIKALTRKVNSLLGKV
jgi:hypothetical protein